jgi:hypothetical protein
MQGAVNTTIEEEEEDENEHEVGASLRQSFIVS